MAKKLKIYNGSSWEDVTFAITPPTTNVTNEFTTNQVIDTSTSVAALRITQRGSGEAFRVEDSTTPDSTPFVIDAAGNVGIGGTYGGAYGKLQVLGSGYQSLSVASNDSSGATFALAANSNIEVRLNTLTNHPMTFRVNDIEHMRITPSGDIGIGNQNPVYRIDLGRGFSSATVGDTSLFIRLMTSAGNQDMLQFYSERTLAGGAAWTTQDWVIRRLVDSTPMSSIRWVAGEFNPITVLLQPNSRAIRTTHISTGTPSGGNDGDVWLTYTA